MKRLVTVIGRGHSGTRAMALTLQASGVHMGDCLNKSTDLLPPGDMYDACRVMASHVQHLGNATWDFSDLHTMPIDPEFSRLIESYLASVFSESTPLRGWKIPETTLVYPWIARMFPDAYYIHWYRDPRDCILGSHTTDDIAKFGVPYTPTDDEFERRAISWKYQSAIMKATPRPANMIVVRFEDFVLKQEEALDRLSEFLGFPLARIAVRPDSVGRWKTNPDYRPMDCLADELRELGYA